MIIAYNFLKKEEMGIRKNKNASFVILKSYLLFFFPFEPDFFPEVGA